MPGGSNSPVNSFAVASRVASSPSPTSVPSKHSSRTPKTNSAAHLPKSPNPLRSDTPTPSSPSSENGNTPSIAGAPLPPFLHGFSPIGTPSPRASRSTAPPTTPPSTFG